MACHHDGGPAPARPSADLGAPPANDPDAPPPRQGYVSIRGRWARSGDRWVWLAGYYERDRPGYSWQPGRWVTTPRVPKPPPQAEWATTVRDVSSEYSSDSWSARRILGPPDVYPASGDLPEAWASLTPDANEEYIEVGFGAPMRTVGVDIYETFNPGAVSLVQLIGEDKVTSIVPDPANEQPLRVRATCTDEPVIAVRVTLASAQVPGWNELDAIGLVPCE